MADRQPAVHAKQSKDHEMEITKQFSRYNRRDLIKLDHSSLFIIVKNILDRSTRIIDDLVEDDEAEYEEKANDQKTVDPKIDPKIEIPVCKLKKILSQIMLLCEDNSEGEEMVHEKTKSILDIVSAYKLTAMAVLTLAAFAMEFGDFWLLFQSYQSAPDLELVKSMAVLKRVSADSMRRKTARKFKPTRDLIRDIMELIGTMLEVEHLSGTNDRGQTKVKELDVYWIMSSVVACAAQMKTLTCATKPQNLTLYCKKLSSILQEYKEWLNELKEKEAVNIRYQNMLKVYDQETNITEVLRAIFFSCSNKHQLIKNSNSKDIDIVELKKMERVFLFISGISDNADYMFDLQQIHAEVEKRNQLEHFKIIWAPIGDRRNAEGKNKLDQTILSKIPGYTIRYISDEASIRYMKEKWHYNGEPILLVMNSKAKIDAYNAFHYINAAGGMKAYPFDEDSINQDLITDKWPDALVGNHSAKVKEWMTEQKFIFFYGGRQKTWSREFEIEVEKLKKKLKNTIELCPVLMSEESEKSTYLKTKIFWSRLEGLFLTSTTTTTTDASKEIRKLYLYKKADAWALLIRGSTPVIAGNGLTFLEVVKELEKTNQQLDGSKFGDTFIVKHERLIGTTIEGGKHPCCRFEISSNLAVMKLKDIPCPVCKGNHKMKKKEIVIYECCHEEDFNSDDEK